MAKTDEIFSMEAIEAAKKLVETVGKQQAKKLLEIAENEMKKAA